MEKATFKFRDHNGFPHEVEFKFKASDSVVLFQDKAKNRAKRKYPNIKEFAEKVFEL